MWKKAMDYLGLGPDDAYDDYDAEPEPAPRGRGRGPRERDSRDPRDARDYDTGAQPRYADYDEAPSRSSQRPSFPQRESDVVVRRPAPAPDDSSVQPRPLNPPPVRPQPVRSSPGPMAEPHSVRPRRFDAAQEVADKFKEGSPVIMNLEGCERDVARRLIDFASGICYALNGSMEKVATGVYLLKPYGSNHHG